MGETVFADFDVFERAALFEKINFVSSHLFQSGLKSLSEEIFVGFSRRTESICHCNLIHMKLNGYSINAESAGARTA